MSGDGTVQVAPDSTGKKVDTSELTVNSQTVERQRVVQADPADPLGLGAVKNSAPAGTEYAPVTRPIAPATLPLPTGAAKETGGNLDTLVAHTPALGPALKAASSPVTIATDQPAVPVSMTTLPALAAGGALIGKVGIDQTTPGISNAVAVSDGLGNDINSLSGGVGHTGLLVAQGGTDYITSANNSTVAQLGAGATFTGVIETIFNEPDISILLTSDQPGTLHLIQYIDAGGTRIVSNWSFPIAAGVPFSRSFVGNGNYFNLTFQNTGASTTTTLNINTAYGNIFPSNNLGNVPMSIGDIGGGALVLGQAASPVSIPVTIATDQEQDLFIIGQAAQSVLGNNVLLASAGTSTIDTVAGYPTSYEAFYCQIIGSAGIASGQIIFEGSNDNVTFLPLTVYDDAAVTGAPINTATAIAASTNRFFSGKLTYRYFRCRISTVFSGGTIQAITRFVDEDYNPRITSVANPTAANLQATVTATNLSCNVAQLAGTAPVTAGVAGTLAVGGNVAPGSAQTADPLVAGAVDPGALTRRVLSDIQGGVQKGNSSKPTYVYNAQAQALTATPANLAIIEAGTTKIPRLKKITIWNPGMQTTAGMVTFNITRSTTAGSAGAVTPAQMNPADAAYSGIVRSNAGTSGTLGTVLYQFSIWVPAALAAAQPFVVDFTSDLKEAPILAAGITNGFVIQVATGNAGASGLSATIEFTEE